MTQSRTAAADGKMAKTCGLNVLMRKSSQNEADS